MADLANLTLAVDSTQVKTGTAALDGLTAAGTRAETMAAGLGASTRAAGVEATSMAAAAQAAARAAVEQGAGFTKATEAARLNTTALRESLVVAREISRGNFTRLPGSLTILAQGVAAQGGLKSYASALVQTLGLVKTVQDAELAEEATLAQNAATALRAAAQRAGANILAADTELALAEAQLRVAEGATAEAAAQARIAAAHEAQTAAAAEAAVAENALAVAQERAVTAAVASAEAASLGLTAIGTGVIGATVGIVAGAVAVQELKRQVDDSGELTRFRDNLGLTRQEMLKLSDGVEPVSKGIKTLGEVQLTTGDVLVGVWDTIKDGAAYAFGSVAKSLDSVFGKFFADTLKATGKEFAGVFGGIGAVSYAVFQAVKDIWANFPAIFGDLFIQGANAAIGALNKLVSTGVAALNSVSSLSNSTFGTKFGQLSAPKIAQLDNPNAGAASKSYADILAAAQRGYAAGAATPGAIYDAIRRHAVENAEDRLQREADALKGSRRPKRERKQGDHGLGEELATLDQQIKGQNALADAYLNGSAAAIRAEATEKALELAIRKHADAGATASLISKELALAVSKASAEGAKQIATLHDDTDARAKVNAMVASGAITLAQANQQLKVESELRPRLAALQAADVQIGITELAIASAKGEQKKTLLSQLAQEIDARNRLAGIIARERVERTANDNEIAHGNALADIAKQNADLARAQFQNSLTGVGAKQSAIALAAYDAQQQAREKNYSPEDAQKLVDQARQLAAIQFKSPFDQWLAGAADVTDALENIKVKGLDGVVSSIGDAVARSRTLGEAFDNVSKVVISDIVQMTLKLLIFRSLSGIFGGGLGGGGGAYGIAGSGGIYANGGVFSGGNVVPFATGGIVTGPSLFPMAGGKTGLMGEAGPEAIMPLGRDASGRLGVRAANNNAPTEVHVIVTASPELNVQIDQRVAGGIAQAAPSIVKASVQATTQQYARRSLMGGRN